MVGRSGDLYDDVRETGSRGVEIESRERQPSMA
jgi:hypothetical protein